MIPLLLLAATLASTDLRIGVAGPLSGPAGPLGQQISKAVELTAQEWNASGGVRGRRVQVIAVDDKNDPREAAAAAARLVREGVWGVVGHFRSSASLAASSVYHDAGIPQITPSSTHPFLTEQGFATLFRTCGRDDRQAQVAARFVLERLRVHRVGIVDDRTEYGRTLAEAFARTLERRRPRLVVAKTTIMQGDRQFPQAVALLRNARADLVYFGGISREAGLLLRQMRGEGIRATFVSGDGVLDTDFVKTAGEEAATGTYLTFSPDPKFLPTAQTFLRTYEKQYGDAGAYAIYAYDAAGVLLRAIERARPKNGSREELLKVGRALHALTYRGALGTLRWDAKGDVVPAPYVVYVTQKGGNILGWFEPATGMGPPRVP